MAESNDKIPKINPNDVEQLIEKFEQNRLDEQEKKLITGLLRTLLALASVLEKKKVSITRLRDMIFGKKREKFKQQGKADEKKDETESTGGLGKGAEKNEAPNSPKNEKPDEPERADRRRGPGHGRKPSSAYVGAKIVHCCHQELQSGNNCLEEGCTGHIYPVKRQHGELQFSGQPIILATHYKQDVLKCNCCFKEYEAPLPEGVKPGRFDATADAAIAISKSVLAVPYYRTAAMQELCGIPLPESVQSERCEIVADALLPIYKQMIREGANGKVFYGDDSPVRIQELIRENKEKVKGERVGMQTGAVVVELFNGARIGLYNNGRWHAGEFLESLYEKRAPELPPPIQMGDALASNWCGKHERVICKCLTHARRKFYEIRNIYPAACAYVLGQIGKIYENEKITRGFSDEERLVYHQQHSGPVLEKLRQWMSVQIEEKKVEPNSSLGAAIKYFLKHVDEGLTAFLQYPGAPLDNNPAEQALKLPVVIRKNSYGYKTSAGAAVGAVILSVLATCRLNGTNAWSYLVSVLRRKEEVKKDPKAFLPWIYSGEQSEESEEAIAA
jgi:transposase